MRILICSDIYPDLSGIAQHTKELTRVLVEKKHSVNILCAKQANKPNYEKSGNTQIFRISFDEVEEFISKHKSEYDLAIVLWYTYLPSIAKAIKNTIYIAPSIRATSLKISSKKQDKLEKQKILLEKKGMQLCKKIIYPSKNIKSQAEKEYSIRRGEIIPHGINLKRFSSRNSKKYEVITIANLHDYRKGIDKLINVASFSSHNFIVLGEGKFRQDYEQLILKNKLKNIHLLGRKENVQDYLRDSKIYVLPSRYEAFGLVLLEAMASGLPCIAFKPDRKNIQTASAEIIQDNKTGFLVKDEKEMAEKIALLLSNDKLRARMSRFALKQSREYSSEKEVEKILKLAKLKKD